LGRVAFASEGVSVKSLLESSFETAGIILSLGVYYLCYVGIFTIDFTNAGLPRLVYTVLHKGSPALTI